MHNRRLTCFLAALLIFFVGSWGSTAAQMNFPALQDRFVNDFANVINSEDEAEIGRLFQQLEADTGIEATVVTIRSMQDYAAGYDDIEPFATAWFNQWGIGNAETNDGVMIIVAVDDRQMRIELGEGYGNFYNSAMQEVINEFMLPRFREGDFSTGIRRGAGAVIGELTGIFPEGFNSSSGATPSISSADSAPSNTTTSSSSFIVRLQSWWDRFFGVIVASAAGLLIGGVQLVRRYLRYRPRNCPDCGYAMERLDEISDDAYLDSGQQLEEYLKSVDYDIWHCPACNHHALHRYPAVFFNYKACPSCQYRTLKTSSRTLRAATYTSTGSKEITKDCQHCDYYDVQTVTIPRKTKSSGSSSSGSSFSSSSSSSFGGGRSSGGGASGKW